MFIKRFIVSVFSTKPEKPELSFQELKAQIENIRLCYGITPAQSIEEANEKLAQAEKELEETKKLAKEVQDKIKMMKQCEKEGKVGLALMHKMCLLRIKKNLK